MRPPRRANGGEIRPLAARINPIKKTRLFTSRVWRRAAVRVQAAISIGDKRNLSGRTGLS
jgi:hypothetical protein